MGDFTDINTLSQTVDFDGSDYINKEKIQSVCPHLSSLEIDTVYNGFDQDHGKTFDVDEHMTHTQISEIFNNLAWYE
jgi:hypothetical protein